MNELWKMFVQLIGDSLSSCFMGNHFFFMMIIFFSGIETLKSYYHFPSAKNGFYHVHLTHKAVWPHGSF